MTPLVSKEINLLSKIQSRTPLSPSALGLRQNSSLLDSRLPAQLANVNQLQSQEALCTGKEVGKV